ncbi:MAG: polyketide beta-ketoacyl:ACP synthase [Pseudonocardiaceae bacterium]|nr:polyketide beta-ketoacyl:ACP synthase [Pseudonocardiaceae bacterium]
MTAEPVGITGMGVQCPIAHDVEGFDEALRTGQCGISYEPPEDDLPAALGFRGRLALEPESVLAIWADAGVAKSIDDSVLSRLRTLLPRASRSARYSVLAAVEACAQAKVDAIADRRRVSLVVAGSNFTQALSFAMSERFRKDPCYVSPRYAQQFWDTDALGVLSEVLDVRGEGSTVGGASAAGNIGLIQGMRLIRSGATDICVVVAGLQDLSGVERMALANAGALMDAHSVDPRTCNRPFDSEHAGLVLSEGTGAIVLERTASAVERGAEVLAFLVDGVSALDGSHLPQPSRDGEEYVMREVLRRGAVDIDEVDLVSAHATGTPLGDETEAAAIDAVLRSGSRRQWVNATKSLLGHCLGSAAMLEAIACVLQIRGEYVHPNINLTQPITEELRFAPSRKTDATVRCVLSNAFGFAGVNAALLLRAVATTECVPDRRKG